MLASSLIVAGATACVAFAMASTRRGGSVADADAAPVSLVAGVAIVVPVSLLGGCDDGAVSCCCSENGVNGKVGVAGVLCSCAEACCIYPTPPPAGVNETIENNGAVNTVKIRKSPVAAEAIINTKRRFSFSKLAYIFWIYCNKSALFKQIANWSLPTHV
jgi:hypothetical protein